mmetsp:Transcript_12552/g.19969  ORF Transcript_12552/g.19969 Transcript_12552/m.19969 type:complete len:171 (-) Transcript_12552:61-573(-)
MPLSFTVPRLYSPPHLQCDLPWIPSPTPSSPHHLRHHPTPPLIPNQPQAHPPSQGYPPWTPPTPAPVPRQYRQYRSFPHPIPLCRRSRRARTRRSWLLWKRGLDVRNVPSTQKKQAEKIKSAIAKTKNPIMKRRKLKELKDAEKALESAEKELSEATNELESARAAAAEN